MSVKVLFLDDEDVILDIYGKFFSNFYETVTCTDSIDAIEVVENFQPDVIVTDMVMPKMNGVEFLTKIRHHKIPAIIITGYADGFKLIDTSYINIAMVKQKPVLMSDIKKYVDSVISGNLVE